MAAAYSPVRHSSSPRTSASTTTAAWSALAPALTFTPKLPLPSPHPILIRHSYHPLLTSSLPPFTLAPILSLTQKLLDFGLAKFMVRRDAAGSSDEIQHQLTGGTGPHTTRDSPLRPHHHFPALSFAPPPPRSPLPNQLPSPLAALLVFPPPSFQP